MKKLYSILVVCGLLVTATSCKKYLDVNTNPNNPTTSTPDLILPQALVSTARYTVQFNTYGGYTIGMIANAGGFGAFGSQTTYNFATTDYTNLFANSYDNINDYQYVVNNTTNDGTDRYFNAAARIMRAFAYQRLVDTYGDVPYTDAVKGAAVTTPKYDKAETIYTDLFVQLNTAIASIDLTSVDIPTPINKGTSGSVDVLFGGDMQKWKAFANTIKLRMLIRIQNVPSLTSVFTAEKGKLAGVTFLSDDAIVQPGYVAQAGATTNDPSKQNPMWDTWAYNAASVATGTGIAQEPTFFAVGFYDGKKLTDGARGAVTYKSLTTYTGQLGSSNNPVAPSGSAWYIGSTTGTAGNAAGILKGPLMGQPIMLAAESYFLQAEANLIGLVPSTTSKAQPANASEASGTGFSNFYNGIRASFEYLYKDQSGNYGYTLGTKALTKAQADADAYAYVVANTAGALINTNTSNITLESIITQKYIAMNMITGDEAYNEYRRTGFPKSVAGTTATTAASILSTATTTDKLPVRIQYPASEYSLNSANVPPAVNNSTSKLFWDIN
jgi:hypothetical protein